MATICPTVTASGIHEFREQLERLEKFAKRGHLDVADGSMTPNMLAPLTQIWKPKHIRTDLHLMVKQPGQYLDQAIKLAPNLIILQAEAEGDFTRFSRQIHHSVSKVGVALLPETDVEVIQPALHMIDHVLIFSGHLGSYGGQANLDLLQKIKRLKSLKPSLEIGWDGGVNKENASVIASAGTDVLNVGGFIQNAEDPRGAYAKLKAIVEESMPNGPEKANDRRIRIKS